eukprot:gene1246-203_t
MLAKVSRRSPVFRRQMSTAAGAANQCATTSSCGASSCSSCPIIKNDENNDDKNENDSANVTQMGPWSRFGRSLFRCFKFDRLFPSDGWEPHQIVELDRVGMTSLRATDIPPVIADKIIYILKKYGRKKDLEKYGVYLRKKVRSRTSVEIPRVLTSETLEEDGNTKLDKLMRSSQYKDLHTIAEQWRTVTESGKVETDISSSTAAVTGTSMSEITRLALAHAEDSRHKLYQMTWSPESTMTYVAAHFPAKYAANFRILYEISMRVKNFKPKSILDFGAGPAPSTVACFELWRDSIEDVLCVEPSPHMTRMGKYITGEFSANIIRWQSSFYDTPQKFDLIVMSFVQCDIRGQYTRDALVKKLWNHLTDSGMLVFIEPGTPTGFRFIHHTRELFINKLGVGKFHFVAPCPHEGMCPLAVTGRDWCHFGQRVFRLPHKVYNKGSRARFFEESKFSYLVVKKGPGPRQNYASETEAPTAAEKSYFWPRIVYPVIRAGQHALIDVCSAPHDFERISTSKSRPHSLGYRFSRKCQWGDLFRFPKRVTRHQARNYVPAETQEQLEKLAKKARAALRWKQMRKDDEPDHRREQAHDRANYGG